MTARRFAVAAGAGAAGRAAGAAPSAPRPASRIERARLSALVTITWRPTTVCFFVR